MLGTNKVESCVEFIAVCILGCMLDWVFDALHDSGTWRARDLLATAVSWCCTKDGPLPTAGVRLRCDAKAVASTWKVGHC